MTTTALPKPPKAVGSATLSFFDGLVNFDVSLVSLRKTIPKVELVCPTCVEANKPAQGYTCSEGHGPFPQGECHRAMKVDGVLRKVTNAELETLRATVKEEDDDSITLPGEEATFTVYNATDVEAQTFATGTVYRLRPKTGLKPYSMLVDLLTDASLAFICELTYRGAQKMYRCISRDGMLTLTELTRPGELNDPENLTAEYPGALLESATKAAQAAVKPFDGEEYRSLLRDRIAALEDAKRDPNAPTPEPVAAKPKKDDSDALIAALDASLDAAPKKPTKKAAKRVKKVA